MVSSVKANFLLIADTTARIHPEVLTAFKDVFTNSCVIPPHVEPTVCIEELPKSELSRLEGVFHRALEVTLDPTNFLQVMNYWYRLAEHYGGVTVILDSIAENVQRPQPVRTSPWPPIGNEQGRSSKASILDLPMDNSIPNILARGGVRTIGELCDRSERAIKMIYMIGDERYNNIVDALASLDFLR